VKIEVKSKLLDAFGFDLELNLKLKLDWTAKLDSFYRCVNVLGATSLRVRLVLLFDQVFNSFIATKSKLDDLALNWRLKISTNGWLQV